MNSYKIEVKKIKVLPYFITSLLGLLFSLGITPEAFKGDIEIGPVILVIAFVGFFIYAFVKSASKMFNFKAIAIVSSKGIETSTGFINWDNIVDINIEEKTTKWIIHRKLIISRKFNSPLVLSLTFANSTNRILRKVEEFTNNKQNT